MRLLLEKVFPKKKAIMKGNGVNTPHFCQSISVSTLFRTQNFIGF
jgi:hypothetical protein